MGIERDGVREGQGTKIVGRIRRGRGERPIGAIDMEPQVEVVADGSQLRKSIDRACGHGPPGADDHERTSSGCDISLDGRTQRRELHPILIVGFDPANGVRPEPGEVCRLLDPRVGPGGPIHLERESL